METPQSLINFLVSSIEHQLFESDDVNHFRVVNGEVTWGNQHDNNDFTIKIHHYPRTTAYEVGSYYDDGSWVSFKTFYFTEQLANEITDYINNSYLIAKKMAL